MTPRLRVSWIAMGSMLLVAAAGCRSVGGEGELRARSESDDPVELRGHFGSAVYMVGDAQSSVYLSDIPLEQLAEGGRPDGQFLHVELLWIPKPGRTPVEASATNVSLTYVIVTAGEIGIYSGGGFADLKGRPGDERLTLKLGGGSLRLTRSTPGFRDLLTPGTITGRIDAVLEPVRTQRIRFALSQMVTDAFGTSMFVHATEPEALDAPQPQVLR